jgi:hypothetical protein
MLTTVEAVPCANQEKVPIMLVSPSRVAASEAGTEGRRSRVIVNIKMARIIRAR